MQLLEQYVLCWSPLFNQFPSTFILILYSASFLVGSNLNIHRKDFHLLCIYLKLLVLRFIDRMAFSGSLHVLFQPQNICVNKLFWLSYGVSHEILFSAVSWFVTLHCKIFPDLVLMKYTSFPPLYWSVEKPGKWNSQGKKCQYCFHYHNH